MRRAVSILFLVSLCAVSFAAQNAPQKPVERPPEPPVRATAPADADVEAMRADLAHMRTLVGQMQRNLGFVDSGLTPLKHQFELEIEMWNVLINDMQRRLNAQSGRIQPAANTAPPTH
jgi:hypothetical protein